jgi:serine/threonine-protein kinase
LLGCLLARDRSERPSSAAQVRDTLRGLLLGETLRAVAGNPSLHDLSASELGRIVGSGRDPTPLAVPLATQREAAERDRANLAEPVAGKKITVPTPIARAVVRARTVLTHVRKGVSDTSMPRRHLALGCAAAAACAVALTCLLSWALGDGGEVGRTAKREHATEPSPAVAPPAAVESESPRELDTPTDLAAFETQLVSGASARDRGAAARAILDHAPQEEVPPVLQKLAELEGARGCRDKREIVVGLGRLGDARALPALRRLDEQPRNRCGNLFRRRDCLGCLREELRQAVDALDDP